MTNNRFLWWAIIYSSGHQTFMAESRISAQLTAAIQVQIINRYTST